MKKVLAEIRDLEASFRDGKLLCDGMGNESDCKEPVAYIDRSGFVYCDRHGKMRKQYEPCRKLKPSEVKTLATGKPLAKY